MVNIPIKVAESLKRLRETSAHYVAVKVIRSRYYAFEVTGRWDKALKKRKTITRYLGRITAEGNFIPVLHRAELEIKPVEAKQLNLKPSEYDLTILTNFSMNGRIPVPVIAERLRLSVTSARYQIDKVEKAYKVEYVAETDAGALGYLGYITFVRFEDKSPSFAEIREVLERESRVQLVATTTGEYQLVIFFLARSNGEIANFLYNLQANTVFNKYKSEFYTTPDFNSYGFIPFRERFFSMLGEQVWERTKESPRPKPGQITRRELSVLKELSHDGAMDFSKIDVKYGYNKGVAQYVYHKLKESGIIKRITISITPPNLKYNALVLAKILDGKRFEKTRTNLFREIISQDRESPINRYALVSNIETPHGVLFVFPSLKDSELHLIQMGLQKQVEGIELTTMVITDMVFGSFCYRRLDNTHSRQFKRLVEEYKVIKPQPLTRYE
jgi:DNA-binding Lrp family transcriptional regulator